MFRGTTDSVRKAKSIGSRNSQYGTYHLSISAPLKMIAAAPRHNARVRLARTLASRLRRAIQCSAGVAGMRCQKYARDAEIIAKIKLSSATKYMRVFLSSRRRRRPINRNAARGHIVFLIFGHFYDGRYNL